MSEEHQATNAAERVAAEGPDEQVASALEESDARDFISHVARTFAGELSAVCRRLHAVEGHLVFRLTIEGVVIAGGRIEDEGVAAVEGPLTREGLRLAAGDCPELTGRLACPVQGALYLATCATVNGRARTACLALYDTVRTYQVLLLRQPKGGHAGARPCSSCRARGGACGPDERPAPPEGGPGAPEGGPTAAVRQRLRLLVQHLGGPAQGRRSPRDAAAPREGPPMERPSGEQAGRAQEARREALGERRLRGLDELISELRRTVAARGAGAAASTGASASASSASDEVD